MFHGLRKRRDHPAYAFGLMTLKSREASIKKYLGLILDSWQNFEKHFGRLVPEYEG